MLQVKMDVDLEKVLEVVEQMNHGDALRILTAASQRLNDLYMSRVGQAALATYWAGQYGQQAHAMTTRRDDYWKEVWRRDE